MRFLPSLAIFLACAALSGAAAPPAPYGPVPSPAQLAWQQDELTPFVHFGMNTFTGRSTGLGNEVPALFNPTGHRRRRNNRFARSGPRRRAGIQRGPL